MGHGDHEEEVIGQVMRAGSATRSSSQSEALYASRTYLPITAGGRGPVTRTARSVSCASPQPHRGGGLDRAKALRYPAAQTASASAQVFGNFNAMPVSTAIAVN